MAFNKCAKFNQDVNLSKQKDYFYAYFCSLKGSNESRGDEHSEGKREILLKISVILQNMKCL